MAADPLQKKMVALVKDTQYKSRFVRSVQTLQARKDFSDLCFVCARGYKVYAHKLLLCSLSNLLKEVRHSTYL